VEIRGLRGGLRTAIHFRIISICGFLLVVSGKMELSVSRTDMHRIEISLKNHVPDARGLGLVEDIADLGIKSVSAAKVQIFTIWMPN